MLLVANGTEDEDEGCEPEWRLPARFGLNAATLGRKCAADLPWADHESGKVFCAGLCDVSNNLRRVLDNGAIYGRFVEGLAWQPFTRTLPTTNTTMLYADFSSDALIEDSMEGIEAPII